jgi:hypothetical protein
MNNVEPIPAGDRNLWIYFFAVLAALGVVAVVVPIYYNRSMQLKEEDVIQARKLWEVKGPRDYDLELMRREHRLVSGSDVEEIADEYRVKVRDGRVTSVVSKARGDLLVDETVGLALGPVIRVEPPPDDLPPLTVEDFFKEIEARIQSDRSSASGRKNYAMASFVMKEDGHPTRYVHRVAGSKQRIEWNAKLTRMK